MRWVEDVTVLASGALRGFIPKESSNRSKEYEVIKECSRNLPSIVISG
jgi:hypothetical protein